MRKVSARSQKCICRKLSIWWHLKVRRNKVFYSVQQLADSLQHPSLQQLLLHSPVLQPSLQQPSAQQVSLQQVSILSDNSFITELPC